ncbi:MAG: ABC transporter permease [Oscillospiraceae bacterium]|nr:ABC transporter permease [Oscillospiraceae bacterium]
MKKFTETLKSYFPIIGFVLVVAVFAILTRGRLLAPATLQGMLATVMQTALVSIGSVFVFGAGCFDMSMGGTLCMSAVVGCYAGIATGNVLVIFLACLAVSLVLNVLKGLFASYVEVPLFIVTIVLGSILSALVLVMMGTETTIFFSNAVKEIVTLNNAQLTALNLAVLVVYFLVCLVLFNYTRLGREVKLLGGNPDTFRQTGLSAPKVKLLAFVVAAFGVALAAFVMLMRSRTAGSATGSSMGTDVMVALVLGGMPLTGGPRSRISAGLIGAATITVLNMGLTMMGLSTAVVQIFRAIVFIAVVYVASMTYRTKLLPR